MHRTRFPSPPSLPAPASIHGEETSVAVLDEVTDAAQQQVLAPLSEAEGRRLEKLLRKLIEA